MKLTHALLAALWVVAVTAEAQTQCIDDGISIVCYGEEPAHLIRYPDGSGVTGTVDNRPWELRVMPPDGLQPLPQLPQLGTQSLQPGAPVPGYWRY